MTHCWVLLLQFICVTITVWGFDAGELVLGTFNALEPIQKIFGSQKSRLYLPNHALSCLDVRCAGFEYLNTDFVKTYGVVRRNDLREHLINHVKGSVYEAVFIDFLNKVIPTLGGLYNNVSFAFESDSGSAAHLHASWSFVDEKKDGDIEQECKLIREEENMPASHKFYHVSVAKSVISFKLAKLRVVVLQTKKSFLSDSSVEVIEYIDPTLSESALSAILTGINMTLSRTTDRIE
eukprot:UN02051